MPVVVVLGVDVPGGVDEGRQVALEHLRDLVDQTLVDFFDSTPVDL